MIIYYYNLKIDFNKKKVFTKYFFVYIAYNK